MIVMKAYAMRRARLNFEMIPLQLVNQEQQKSQIYNSNTVNSSETPFSTPSTVNEPSTEPLAPRSSKIAAKIRIHDLQKA